MRQLSFLPGLKKPAYSFFAVLILAACFTKIMMPAAFAEDEKIMALSIVSEPDVTPGKTMQLKMTIDVPPQLVWETLTNYPEIKHILPGYYRSTVLKANGNLKLVDIGMKVSPFLPSYRYQVQMREDLPGYNLNIRRISGDFKSLSANYKLISQNHGARTLVIYNLSLDPGINLPGSQAIIKANTERSMKAMALHILQESRKSLIGQQ